jgi:hypothetical protein
MHLLLHNILDLWVEHWLLLLNSPLLLNSSLLVFLKSDSKTLSLRHVADVAYFSESEVVVLASVTGPVSISV